MADVEEYDPTENRAENRENEIEEYDDNDQDLDAMKDRLRKLEEEANTIKSDAQPPPALGGPSISAPPMPSTDPETQEADARSVYVGNVDYGATPEEIQSHFQNCGTINRVTILCDKWTNHPKGYAYVEFADPSVVQNAVLLNESLFRGRLIKVTPKRTNLPGMSERGRGRGRGGYRGGFRGFRGYNPYFRPRGFRGRGRGAF